MPSNRRTAVLVVDDAPELRLLWTRVLESRGYEIHSAPDGQSGLEWLRSHDCTLVLCDQVMPGISGIEFVREVRTFRPGLPVVMVTGAGDVDLARQALREGAADFLTKPFRMAELPLAIERTLERLRLQAQAIEVGQAHVLLGAISSLAVAIDARDPYSATHSRSVAAFCVRMAQYLNLHPAEAELLRLAALLHDVGKIALPDSILKKSTRLSPEEWDLIKQHPSIGANIVGEIKELAPVADVLRHHHERPDGNGYPDRLRGDAIPFLSGLISVADAYDAMTSDRIYRSRLPVAEARRRLAEGSGTQFIPSTVDALQAVLDLQSEEGEYLSYSGDGADLGGSVLAMEALDPAHLHLVKSNGAVSPVGSGSSSRPPDSA